MSDCDRMINYVRRNKDIVLYVQTISYCQLGSSLGSSFLVTIFLMVCPDVWTYIEETRHTTGNLEQRVSSAKDNVENMNNIMAKWCDYPLYERKEKRGLLNLDVSTPFAGILLAGVREISWWARLKSFLSRFVQPWCLVAEQRTQPH